jgi:hypothetical protein
MARPKPSPRLIAAVAVAHLRVASAANMSNSVAYVLIGRKRSGQPTSP